MTKFEGDVIGTAIKRIIRNLVVQKGIGKEIGPDLGRGVRMKNLKIE